MAGNVDWNLWGGEHHLDDGGATFGKAAAHDATELAADDHGVFSFALPPDFDGVTALDVVIRWVFKDTLGGDSNLAIAFQNNPAGFDATSTVFAADQTTTPVTQAAGTLITETAITVPTTAIDSMGAGDRGRVRIKRLSASDTNAGLLGLLQVRVRIAVT